MSKIKHSHIVVKDIPCTYTSRLEDALEEALCIFISTTAQLVYNQAVYARGERSAIPVSWNMSTYIIITILVKL